MKAAKKFRWEAAHRLQWHEGECSNLHGHSYRMTVEMEGETDRKGMVVDYKAIKKLLKPLVDAWDHAILVSSKDDELCKLLEKTDWKHAILPFDTTAENLCAYVADQLVEQLDELPEKNRIDSIYVRIQETETCYAEAKVSPDGA